MSHDIKPQPIMMSVYFKEENKDIISDRRLKNIADGEHPRPSFGEVVKLAKELIQRRAKDGN